MNVRKLKRLYESFRESPATRAKKIRVKLPKAVMVMGYLEFVGYSTTRGKKGELYKHTFARGSRPLLCAGIGRNQLYLIGGRYHVTNRGIVDLTPNGKEIDD